MYTIVCDSSKLCNQYMLQVIESSWRNQRDEYMA